jgi:hypothetical protein
MKTSPLTDIKVTLTSTDTITRKIYNVTYDGDTYTYIDYYSDGVIVDTIVRDEYGNNIDNAEVLQEIIYVIDQQIQDNE